MITSAASGQRRACPDDHCRALATEFLTTLAGQPPDAVWWDADYRLKAHVEICGCELVLIAPRDEAHTPVVATAPDWNEILCADAKERSALLERYAIADRDRLATVLSATRA